MKIIQVIPKLGYGGAEIICENLTLALKNLGHTVIVISLSGERTEISTRLKVEGIQVEFLNKKKGI